MWNLFRLNNSDARTTSVIFWCLYCWLWTLWTDYYCSGNSVVALEQVNADCPYVLFSWLLFTFYFSLPLSLLSPLSLPLSVSLARSLSLSRSLSLFLSLSISIYLSLSLSLSIFFFISIYLYLIFKKRIEFLYKSKTTAIGKSFLKYWIKNKIFFCKTVSKFQEISTFIKPLR